MSDLVNQLTAHTGLSPELVQKGLGALLSFLKKELGEENFAKLETSIPGARRSRPNTSRHRKAGKAPPHQGGLFEMVAGLAGKLLGGKAGEGVDLLSTLSKLGFKPEQIESFLPKAIELIKNHLSPELIQKLVAAMPVLEKLLGFGASKEQA